MTPALSDRDRERLRAFPITEDLATILGPQVPPVILGPGGMSVPGSDYESWTVITASSREIPVPLTVVRQAQAANGGALFHIEFGAAPAEECQRMWLRELSRLRDQLNTIAAELVP